MATKRDATHPYLRGWVFWAPIITQWINSASYTEKAKEDFRESLEKMLQDKNILTIEMK